MSQTKQASVSGRDHYDGIYRKQLANEAEWLDRTARHKVDSIEHLLLGNGITCQTMLELGCGTGSVIRECQRRGLAESYIAVDYSETAIDYLRAHSQGIETHVADVTDAELAFDRPVDLIVVSHVIEHLEEPIAFLESLQNDRFPISDRRGPAGRPPHGTTRVP